MAGVQEMKFCSFAKAFVLLFFFLTKEQKIGLEYMRKIFCAFVCAFVLLFFCFLFFEQEHKGTNNWAGVQEMMLCAFVRALVLLFNTEAKS